MSMRHSSFAPLLALVLAACGSKAPASPPPGGGGPAGPPTVTVTPTADISKAYSSTVGSAGGYLYATAADGTNYSLSVPAGALLADVTITMTPLTAVAGMPFDTFLGGVKLEPDGLQLKQAATLSIVLPAPVDASKVVGMGYHLDGAGFHLAPSQPGATYITLSLFHFSGAGAASASPAQIATQGSSATSSPADGYEQQLESARAAAQARGLPIDDPGLRAQWGAIFAAWGREVVVPALTAAESDDTRFDAAFDGFVQWDRQQALLGFPYHFGDAASPIWKSVQKGLRFAFDKAREKCATDPTQARMILRRGREAALLGIDIGYTRDQEYGFARGCATFQVTFDSVARTDASNGYWVGRTHGTFQVQPTPDLLFLQGSGSLEYLSYDDVNSTKGKRIEAILTPGTIRLEKGTLPIDVPEAASSGPLVRLVLGVPTPPTEDITYVTISDGFRFHWGSSPSGWWSNFRSANAAFRNYNSTAWEFTYSGFTGTPASMHLERTASDSYTYLDGQTQNWSTTDTVDLVHTPQP